MRHLLLLLILLSCVSMGVAVAGCHSDRDKDHRPRENCTAAGFSDIPVGLEPTTKVLLFPSNLFSSLSWSSFQVFPEIYEIDLTGNKVPEVTPTASPILPTLSVLRLGSNRLTSLPDGSFSACPGLTELYLENNAINSLSDHTFSGLTKLEILELSSNHIKVLPQSMLHPLPAIETLYLEKNKISVMPDEWFSRKEEVPYLYLSANPWACTCSLGYLRRYLDDYELNVYVRDGPEIKSDVESVVCDAPRQHKGTPVTNLEESDLCLESGPHGDFYQPTTQYSFYPSTSPPVPDPSTSSPRDSTTFVDLYTMHTTITRSWYEVITRLIERSEYSHKAITTETSVGLHDLTTYSTTSTAGHLTKTQTIPVETTTAIALTTTLPTTTTTTMKIVTTTTTEATTAYEALTTTKSSPDEKQEHEKLISSRPAGVFCMWLFAGCLLLCVASAVCILVTLANMVIWYRRVYKPLCLRLARRRGGSEGLMLLTYDRVEGKEVGGEGVMALYRSVLLVHREAGEGMQREDVGERGEGDGKQGQLVILKPAGGGATREEEGERSGKEERAVYKKTLYRLLSKEEEIEGWRDVVEECRVSEEDGGQKGDQGRERERSRGGEGVSKKRYSVILREERQDVGGGKEELDWVVGGWEVKRGGAETEEEPRSSWGEWLAHYLPSMPWGVTTPPEAEAAL
ncbi:hypothetical protein ACER0C_002308 [Sarotherodon galilaeus]